MLVSLNRMEFCLNHLIKISCGVLNLGTLHIVWLSYRSCAKANYTLLKFFKKSNTCTKNYYFFAGAASSAKIHTITKTLYIKDRNDKNQKNPVIPKYL